MKRKVKTFLRKIGLLTKGQRRHSRVMAETYRTTPRGRWNHSFRFQRVEVSTFECPFRPVLILDDVARCHGDSSEPICQGCARRLQMDHDDPPRQYPHINKRPTTKMSCSLFVQPRKGALHVSNRIDQGSLPPT